MKIRTLLADDEAIARSVLRNYLAKIPQVEVLAECADGQSAWQVIEREPLDLLLLDIQMPEQTGLALAEKVATRGLPVIVFVTAYDQFAVQAFENNAIDYLLKPFDEARFEKTIQKAIRQVELVRNGDAPHQAIDLIKKLWQPDYPEIITVKDGGRIQLVRVADLTHVEAYGNYVMLHTEKTKYLLTDTLTQLENRLNPKHFTRIHRSTIVHLNYVKEIQSHFNGDYSVILQNGKVLRMSRTYKSNLLI
jgi:two-component system, LytTR family, response regulator